jgi:hypothetical protein
MVKQIFYKQVKGRRAEDSSTEWKLDPWKVFGTILVTTLIGWGTWVTINSFRAENADKKIDLQTEVLHNRVTGLQMVEEADETRLENRLWELQKRFYEKEISDCLEDLNDCEKEK